MREAEKLSLEAIGGLIAASEEIRFGSENRQQVYGWVDRVLVQQEYAGQGTAARGLVRRYVEKMTGLSRTQVTRLIAHCTATGQVRSTVYRRRRFPEHCTRADIELLASVDEAHETLSGPATRRILQSVLQHVDGHYFHDAVDAFGSRRRHRRRLRWSACNRSVQIHWLTKRWPGSVDLRLPVRHSHFHLPKQAHNLLCLMFLSSSRHSRFLSYQLFSHQLVQKTLGTPIV